MIWVLLGLGVLMIIPLFFKTIGCVIRIILGILGPLIVIAMVVLLILGIIF
jgi:hypothetical protein